MSASTQIRELIKRLDNLPLRHEDQLRVFLVDLKFTLRDIFGPSHQYLDYLKFVKFRPDAVFATEREMQRSWLSGKAQVANLLQVILNDPAVRTGEPDTEGSIVDDPVEDHSIRQFTDMQNSIFGVMAQRQKEILSRPVIEEQGPLSEPLRKDYESPAAVSVPSETDTLAGAARILVVPGSDQLMMREVTDFLEEMSLRVTVKENADGRRALLEHLDGLAQADFAVVILDADFYFYPRTQSADRACLMAAQETIFQLGYLAAKLGRERVAVLYRESDHFRRPTDYFDIYYVPLSSNAVWKTELAKRMKGCGLALSSKADAAF